MRSCYVHDNFPKYTVYLCNFNCTMEVTIVGKQKTLSDGKKIIELKLFHNNVEYNYIGWNIGINQNDTLKQHLNVLTKATSMDYLAQSKSICRYYIFYI